MTTPVNPSNPKPAGDKRNLVAVDQTYTAVTFEDKLHQFWRQNRLMVLGVCVAVVVGFLVKAGWEYLAEQKELDIEKELAGLTTTDQLKTFAAEHPNHSLAGIAQIRLADEAYAAGKPADAVAGYERALAVIKDGPLAARIRLGRAIAKVQAGRSSEGSAELAQLANDASQFSAVRAEAAYQLASLASEAGNGADVQKYTNLLKQIDPASMWTQRAVALPANPPASLAPEQVATPVAPATSKKEQPTSSAPITLPRK